MAAQEQNDLPVEVEEAMATVWYPGTWESRDGEIIVGIDGNFNGYPLTAAAVREQMEAWQELAIHFGVVETSINVWA